MKLAKELHPTIHEEMVDWNRTFNEVLNIILGKDNEDRPYDFCIHGIYPDKVIALIL